MRSQRSKNLNFKFADFLASCCSLSVEYEVISRTHVSATISKWMVSINFEKIKPLLDYVTVRCTISKLWEKLNALVSQPKNVTDVTQLSLNVSSCTFLQNSYFSRHINSLPIEIRHILSIWKEKIDFEILLSYFLNDRKFHYISIQRWYWDDNVSAFVSWHW